VHLNFYASIEPIIWTCRHIILYYANENRFELFLFIDTNYFGEEVLKYKLVIQPYLRIHPLTLIEIDETALPSSSESHYSSHCYFAGSKMKTNF